MPEFDTITNRLALLIKEWEPRLLALSETRISDKINSQNRSVKQILGHLIDSASNNTHRIIHLQYQSSPLQFPNYATHGNNDRWIAIQNYRQEDWKNMIQLWKYANLHIIHVISNVDNTKLNNQWYYDDQRLISLREGIIDYLRHFELHLKEINVLIEEN